MTEQSTTGTDPAALFAAMFDAPQKLYAQFMLDGTTAPNLDFGEWGGALQRMQALLMEFQQEQTGLAAGKLPDLFDPGAFTGMMQNWLQALPLTQPTVYGKLWEDSLAMWRGVAAQLSGSAPKSGAEFPLNDRRFADPKWREQPFFAVLHQSYLMLAEQVLALADAAPGGDEAKREQVKFAARTLVEALSPAHFALTNPVAMSRAIETKGESVVRGMENLLRDLKRGQLTHVDPEAFKLGENIAVTPGKVVHETPLYQLIQYSPTTDKVLEVPLVIFPPWINRFYILDLNPQKSFIRWAVEQGITVFIVSWKSADETMAETIWDDYIRAEIDAIDTVRARLNVPTVHAIGYCVAGTTLAATLAILARRGQADKVKSATFFTAQVDFELGGELKVFIDEGQIDLIGQAGKDTGYTDGRVMAATFNLLRGNDLIWSYVVKNYLLGEDYPAFDLLHWNGDVTNLPAKWHQAYLRDLYKDNKLVVPNAMAADGTPIDLTRIATPAYIQAGREDHIAPAPSVWRLTRHLRGPWTFLLAGSGHIAGVVNPPAAGKYQYWTNPGETRSYEDFVAGAAETKGSWWPHWLDWLHAQDAAEVSATGKRVPGAKGDSVIEDAPGRYVMAR